MTAPAGGAMLADQARALLRSQAILLVVGNPEDFSRVDLGVLRGDKRYVLAIIEDKIEEGT